MNIYWAPTVCLSDICTVIVIYSFSNLKPIKFSLFSTFKKCVCVCDLFMCVHMCMYEYPWKPGGNIWSLGAGVPGLLTWVLTCERWPSCRVVSALDHWAPLLHCPLSLHTHRTLSCYRNSEVSTSIPGTVSSIIESKTEKLSGRRQSPVLCHLGGKCSHSLPLTFSEYHENWELTYLFSLLVWNHL